MNRMSQISGSSWTHDPIYSPFYHPTGFIMAAASEKLYRETVLPYAKEHETEPDYAALDSPEEWQAVAPRIFTGLFPSWRGVWRKKGAGWLFARGALEAVHREASRLGVTFITGSTSGNVTDLVFDDRAGKILGANTADGKQYISDLTMLSAGAGSDALLDFKGQLRPTAWTLAHIPLSIDELEQYKNLPVPYNVERGFFIEPNVTTREIKICDEHPGYCNFVRDSNGEILSSKPFAKNQIPLEAEARMKRVIQETMPQLMDREFSFARICWDADTVDRVFLIDFHPNHSNLILACGASGHGVNPMPAIGIVVADLVQGKMEERLHKMSRWRPEQAINRNWHDTQGRHGADEKIMEFKDVQGWSSIGN